MQWPKFHYPRHLWVLFQLKFVYNTRLMGRRLELIEKEGKGERKYSRKTDFSSQKYRRLSNQQAQNWAYFRLIHIARWIRSKNREQRNIRIKLVVLVWKGIDCVWTLDVLCSNNGWDRQQQNDEHSCSNLNAELFVLKFEWILTRNNNKFNAFSISIHKW